MKKLFLLALSLSILATAMGCSTGGSEAGPNPPQANRPVSADPGIPKGEK